MVRNAATRTVIEVTLERCCQVADGLDNVRPELTGVLPARSMAEIKTDRRVSVASVALLKRMEQLRNLLIRLMRALVTWESSDAQSMTVADVANWREKQRVLVADEWMELTLLGTRLALEDPIDEAAQLKRVNESWVAAEQREGMLANLREWWTARS